MKDILKSNEMCYCLGGGEIQNLGGEISPHKVLKALKKTLSISHTDFIVNVIDLR